MQHRFVAAGARHQPRTMALDDFGIAHRHRNRPPTTTCLDYDKYSDLCMSRDMSRHCRSGPPRLATPSPEKGAPVMQTSHSHNGYMQRQQQTMHRSAVRRKRESSYWSCRAVSCNKKGAMRHKVDKVRATTSYNSYYSQFHLRLGPCVPQPTHVSSYLVVSRHENQHLLIL